MNYERRILQSNGKEGEKERKKPKIKLWKSIWQNGDEKYERRRKWWKKNLTRRINVTNFQTNKWAEIECNGKCTASNWNFQLETKKSFFFFFDFVDFCIYEPLSMSCARYLALILSTYRLHSFVFAQISFRRESCRVFDMSDRFLAISIESIAWYWTEC